MYRTTNQTTRCFNNQIQKTMRKIVTVAIIALLASTTGVMAQNNMEDAIHLKDGSIYRGVIIEQVPNVSYKIRSRDGNVYAVQVADVEKITKEEKPYQRGHYGFHHWKRDSIAYTPKKRGYFFESQALIENVQGGVRIVNGYKFGRFGYLGIGVGADHVFSNPFNPRINGLEKKELSATYSMLYLYHAGDGPTKGRFTPFYAIEAGWAMAMKGWGGNDNRVDDYGNTIKGGPMGGAGLGFKVQSRRTRAHFSLLFNVNYKQVNYTDNITILHSLGQTIGYVKQDDVGHLIIPGIRLGIGF